MTGGIDPRPGMPDFGKVKPFAGRKWLSGVHRIEDERRRQQAEEGWTPEHDDTHVNGELANAAIAYLLHEKPRKNIKRTSPPLFWPWDGQYWKPKDRIRNLERAGALIAAEIDRLQRLENKKGV